MKAKVSGWRIGAPFYGPALLLGAVAFLLLSGWGSGSWAGAYGLWRGLVFLPGLFALNFFRDPQRLISPEPRDIVSPADGVVTLVEPVESTPWYSGPCMRVSIFLNVFNVHVNRSPADATIAKIERQAGLFKSAMAADSAEVNEANTLWLETPHGPMTVRQVAGLIARRIVCPAQVGERLLKGERFGMIRFGSRTELYLPRGADVVVRVGQKVRGGATVVARCERKV